MSQRSTNLIRYLKTAPIFRHTLVGITLESGTDFPRVYTSLLHESILHFVMKDIGGMCGRCGVKNPGENLNEYPWLVAIKETVLDQDFHHTGTLVSREWVVTAASSSVNIYGLRFIV